MNESTHRCTVLVVDDDPDMQELLRVALAADGYDVAVASNGRDALFHLRSTPETCLIVLDLTLPDMDGMQFRAAQRRDRSLGWIPVVVLSGAIDGPSLAHEMGAGAFVPKPVDLDRLRGAMRQIGCCQAHSPAGAARQSRAESRHNARVTVELAGRKAPF